MKVILIVLALSLFSACHAEAQLRSDREKESLLDSVHTIRVEKVLLPEEGGRHSEVPREVSQVTYNERGNKIEETKYSADSSLVSKSVFDYDTAGNLTAVTVYNGEGAIYLRKIFSYTRRPGERRIEESVFKGGTTLQAKTIYTSDNKDRGTESASFDANGKLGMRLVTIYGTNGKPAEVEVFNNSSRTGKVIFSYDAQGNQTGNAEYDAVGVRGNKYVFSGDLKRGSQTEVAEYDANDNLVNKESYVREFDSLGNWTKETKSKLNLQSGKFEPVQVTHRIISYY
jgi:hypothetical protein